MLELELALFASKPQPLNLIKDKQFINENILKNQCLNEFNDYNFVHKLPAFKISILDKETFDNLDDFDLWHFLEEPVFSKRRKFLFEKMKREDKYLNRFDHEVENIYLEIDKFIEANNDYYFLINTDEMSLFLEKVNQNKYSELIDFIRRNNIFKGVKTINGIQFKEYFCWKVRKKLIKWE